MKSDLEHIKNAIELSGNWNNLEKEALMNSIKKLDKEIAILEFKLERTEKVKRTTAILLEETIEELDQKRKAVEESNAALKKSMEELKAAQAQLIQSEKMASLGELTAGIAHEIQNPLNFVNNFSDVSIDLIEEMLEEVESGNNEEVKLISSDIKENLEKIRNHGQRASGIVKGMLQHSRGSSGQKELTDINALADEYLRLAYHGFRAKDKSFNSDFKLEMDETIPKIEIVPQDIGRVLLNLINNAFYTVNDKARQSVNDYKPMVVVDTKCFANKVEIRVTDNGNGIPGSVKEKIFQPFFTTKPTGQGTGLGLSLSYDIVTKGHGGTIEVNSAQGTGTEFILTIPFIEEHA